jgi:dolichol kinase
MSLDICIGLLATILAMFYISKPYVFISLLAALMFGIIVYISAYGGDTAFAGMFAIGTIYGLIYREFALNPKVADSSSSKKRKRTEINRDILQIIFGVILIGALYYFGYANGEMIIFALIILGYLMNNLLANLMIRPIYVRVKDLERKNVSYGLGASYLAASTALMLGFAHNAPLLLFGIVALFFGDAAATIIGISARNAAKLPYNRYKTIVGSLAFFLVTAVLGYLFVGIYAVLLAAILAFIEGLYISLDDNVRSGIAVIILGTILGL